MGNSTSTQGDPQLSFDVNPNQKEKRTKRIKKLKKNRKPTKANQNHDVLSPSVGIISHPYQQNNPGQYEDEYSSSSSDDGDEVDFDHSLIQPRGLFLEEDNDDKGENCPPKRLRMQGKPSCTMHGSHGTGVKELNTTEEPGSTIGMP